MAKPNWHSIAVALTIACPRVMLNHARISNNSLRTNQLGRAQLARYPEVAEVGKLHRPTSRRRNLRRGFSEFSVNSFTLSSNQRLLAWSPGLSHLLKQAIRRESTPSEATLASRERLEAARTARAMRAAAARRPASSPTNPLVSEPPAAAATASGG